jgi:hypothetical protein
MSPTIQQRYPEMFGDMAAPGKFVIPQARSEVVDLMTSLHREMVFARRTADRIAARHGARTITWGTAPKYAKLKYRPLVFGSSPMASARSTLPFDDSTGDALVKRWGIPGGFMQLQGLAKLANLYPAPIADLPLAFREPQARADLLAAHLDAGLFHERVVVLVGMEAQRAFGYDQPGYLGLLDRGQVPGARAVIAMPDPAKHPGWGSPDGRYFGRALFVHALLAARLPSPNAPIAADILLPLDDAPRRGLSEAMVIWRREMGGASPTSLTEDEPVKMWRELCRLGIATPCDLGSRAWWYDPNRSISTMFLDGGRCVVSGRHGEEKRCTLLSVDGTELARAVFRPRSHGLRWAEAEAVARGWDHPFAALDKRLTAMKGGAS